MFYKDSYTNVSWPTYTPTMWHDIHPSTSGICVLFLSIWVSLTYLLVKERRKQKWCSVTSVAKSWKLIVNPPALSWELRPQTSHCKEAPLPYSWGIHMVMFQPINPVKVSACSQFRIPAFNERWAMPTKPSTDHGSMSNLNVAIVLSTTFRASLLCRTGARTSCPSNFIKVTHYPTTHWDDVRWVGEYTP